MYLGKTEEKASAVSAPPSESEPAATAAKKEDQQAPDQAAAVAPVAGAGHAPVERQASKGHARVGKTNSTGDRQGDNSSRGQGGAKGPESVRHQGPGGQQRGPKRTEGPKSPVTGAK